MKDTRSASQGGPAVRAVGDLDESPVLRARGAALAFGSDRLWSGLDLDLAPGEFVTILGPNGSGKSSLLKTILAQQSLSAGSIDIHGEPVRRGDRRIGYIPQQRLIPAGTPMRGTDLVGFGADGHRWGPRLLGRAAVKDRVDQAIDAVQATEFARRPVGQLSGGQQQRLRVAQALVADPQVLLCDEPLNSLDLHHQRAVSRLIDNRRRDHGTAVLFVTHDINPVLSMTDRVLYFAAGRHRLGTPDEVMRTEVLSDLYDTQVEVARIGDRIVVLGAPAHHESDHHAHCNETVA